MKLIADMDAERREEFLILQEVCHPSIHPSIHPAIHPSIP
jgi:hypothetical protein